MGRIWDVTKEQNGHTSSAARNRAHWQHCAARNNLLKSTCCSRAMRGLRSRTRYRHCDSPGNAPRTQKLRSKHMKGSKERYL